MLFQLPLTQFEGLDGRPMSGWSIEFFDEDTSRPLTAYRDADFKAEYGLKVLSDSRGVLPPIWLKPTGRRFRARLTFPDGRERSISGLKLDVANTSDASFSLPKMPGVSKSGATVSIEAADFGRIVSVPSTTTPVPVKLPPARDVPVGAMLGILSSGDGGLVISPPAGQGDAVPVADRGDVAVITSNGASYSTIIRSAPRPEVYLVLSRGYVAPVPGAPPGACYLVPSTASSSNAEWMPDSIYQSRGDGTWTRIKPRVGLVAVVENEKDDIVDANGAHYVAPLALVYEGSAWVNRLDGIRALSRAASSVKSAFLRDEYATGTTSLSAHGSSPTSGSAAPMKLNTVTSSDIVGLILAGSRVTLPKGTFIVRGRKKVSGSFTSGVLNLVNAGSGAVALRGLPVRSDADDADGDFWLECAGRLVVTTPTQFEFQFTLTGFGSATVLGATLNISGLPEVFASVEIEALSLG